MSNVNNQFKELINEAIHNYLHDDTETEMTVKDWFYDLRKQATKADEYEAKAKAFDNLVDVAYWHFERIHPDDDNRLQYESFYDDIRDEFKKLERGESDE